MHDAVLLLGSNINPEKNMRLALNLLRTFSHVSKVSQVYLTNAIGSTGPHFLNQAVLIHTIFSKDKIKNEIITPIEIILKRVRTNDKYAPRTIDLDMIIFDNEVLDPNLWIYKFAAMPVSEIMPDLIHPQSQKTLREIAQTLT